MKNEKNSTGLDLQYNSIKKYLGGNQLPQSKEIIINLIKIAIVLADNFYSNFISTKNECDAGKAKELYVFYIKHAKNLDVQSTTIPTGRIHSFPHIIKEFDMETHYNLLRAEVNILKLEYALNKDHFNKTINNSSVLKDNLERYVKLPMSSKNINYSNLLAEYYLLLIQNFMGNYDNDKFTKVISIHKKLLEIKDKMDKEYNFTIMESFTVLSFELCSRILEKGIETNEFQSLKNNSEEKDLSLLERLVQNAARNDIRVNFTNAIISFLKGDFIKAKSQFYSVLSGANLGDINNICTRLYIESLINLGDINTLNEIAKSLSTSSPMVVNFVPSSIHKAESEFKISLFLRIIKFYENSNNKNTSLWLNLLEKLKEEPAFKPQQKSYYYFAFKSNNTNSNNIKKLFHELTEKLKRCELSLTPEEFVYYFSFMANISFEESDMKKLRNLLAEYYILYPKEIENFSLGFIEKLQNQKRYSEALDLIDYLVRLKKKLNLQINDMQLIKGALLIEIDELEKAEEALLSLKENYSRDQYSTMLSYLAVISVQRGLITKFKKLYSELKEFDASGKTTQILANLKYIDAAIDKVHSYNQKVEISNNLIYIQQLLNKNLYISAGFIKQDVYSNQPINSAFVSFGSKGFYGVNDSYNTSLTLLNNDDYSFSLNTRNYLMDSDHLDFENDLRISRLNGKKDVRYNFYYRNKLLKEFGSPNLPGLRLGLHYAGLDTLHNNGISFGVENYHKIYGNIGLFYNGYIELNEPLSNKMGSSLKMIFERNGLIFSPFIKIDYSFDKRESSLVEFGIEIRR